MSHSVIRLVTFVMFTLVLTACGGQRPQVVTGIQVQSNTSNSDVQLSFQADLDLGNMSFPSVTLPILHPRGQTPIGSVNLLPVLGGKNQIKVSVNLSAIADIHAVTATLPNGNAIPLIANNPTIVVPLGAGAQLYLTMSPNAVAVGVAVPIKQFDGIGATVGGVSLFPTFMIDKVVGSAGIFTSKNAGQNGFAIIADVTQYVKMQDIYVPTAAAKLNYAQILPSAAKENKINEMMYKLNQNKTKLQLR